MRKWSPLQRAAHNAKPKSPIHLQVDTNRILLNEIKEIKKRLIYLENKIGKRKNVLEKE